MIVLSLFAHLHSSPVSAFGLPLLSWSLCGDQLYITTCDLCLSTHAPTWSYRPFGYSRPMRQFVCLPSKLRSLGCGSQIHQLWLCGPSRVWTCLKARQPTWAVSTTLTRQTLARWHGIRMGTFWPLTDDGTTARCCVIRWHYFVYTTFLVTTRAHTAVMYGTHLERAIRRTRFSLMCSVSTRNYEFILLSVIS